MSAAMHVERVEPDHPAAAQVCAQAQCQFDAAHSTLVVVLFMDRQPVAMLAGCELQQGPVILHLAIVPGRLTRAGLCALGNQYMFYVKHSPYLLIAVDPRLPGVRGLRTLLARWPAYVYRTDHHREWWVRYLR